MAFKRSDYPDNWREISIYIRTVRAAYRCECTGECGLHVGARCDEIDGQPAKHARGRVMLTVAHLDHNTHSADPANLRAMCNKCHLRYDRLHHQETARRHRKEKLIKAGQIEMELI